MTASSDFPPVEQADENGLLVIGGSLTPERILAGYRRGIFPWPLVEDDFELLAWWCPDPRAIIELDELHVGRRAERRIRRGEFSMTVNRDFAGVIRACADRGQETGTWITRSMVDAYCKLHELGAAHSVEVWRDGELAGGVYGVAVGGFFGAESMFHRARDASKIALYHLVARLRERGFSLLDVQIWTEHTGRLGAKEISRRDFLKRLDHALKLPVSFA